MSISLELETPVRRIPFLSSALIILSCTCAAADPAPLPADLIVGRWQGDGGTFTLKRPGKEDKVYTRKATFEFRKDGTFTFTEGDLPELKDTVPGSVKGLTMTGKYSFASETELEMVVKIEGKEQKQRLKVAITKDELMLTQGKDESKKYKRTKE